MYFFFLKKATILTFNWSQTLLHICSWPVRSFCFNSSPLRGPSITFHQREQFVRWGVSDLDLKDPFTQILVLSYLQWNLAAHILPPVCAQVLKEEFLPPPNPPRGESTQLTVKSCHCQFSSKEIVHKKSVDSVLCGFSGGTGQRKEMLLFHMSFLNTESHQQNPIHLDSFRCRGWSLTSRYGTSRMPLKLCPGIN